MEKNKFDVAVISPVRFESDPRHIWWLESFTKNGYRSGFIESCSEKAFIFNRKTKKFHDLVILSSNLAKHNGISTSVSQDFAISNFEKIENSNLKNILKILIRDSKTLPSVYSANQIIRILAGLQYSQEFIEPNLIVANDLVTAVAVLLVYGKEKAIIYDAQEIFTDMWDSSSYGSLNLQERRLWIQLETLVCQEVCKVVTVSPGISTLYKNRHAVDTFVIPNFMPIENYSIKHKEDPHINFIFMGNIAPNRGVLKLVEDWSNLKVNNITLDLYIPFSRSYLKLKKQLKNLNFSQSSRIRLLRAVKESKMINILGKYDVGIIPYDYPYPYNHCSPNKLGQYISQELAILANNQPYISNIICEFKIGEIYKSNDEKSFFQSVQLLSDRKHVNELRANSKKNYLSELNWDHYFKKLLLSESSLIGNDKIKINENDVIGKKVNKTIDFQIKSKSAFYKKIIYLVLEYSGLYGHSLKSYLLREILDSNLISKLIRKYSKKYI